MLDASQSWTGYIENYQFPSGSDLLNITFASDAAGNMVGTVTLGTGTPPPPATDPNVGYPASVEAMLVSGGATGIVGYLAEGFAYPIVNGTLTTNRMRFDVNRNDLWQSWCALETPAVDGSGRCTPNWESASSGSPGDSVCQLHQSGQWSDDPDRLRKADSLRNWDLRLWHQLVRARSKRGTSLV